jgi:hypothetical protein
VTGESTVARRRKLKVEMDLPLGEAYGEMVVRFAEG